MGRGIRYALAVLCAAVLLAALGGAWLAWRLRERPDLSRFDRHLLPAAGPAAGPRLTATFLGVATVLFSDGATQIMTDGFFTRVGLADALGDVPVAPDVAAIERGLARAGATQLAAVLPVHSHYDHAMDAPEVARRSGALLLGSRTTAWIGRGGGLPEAQIRVAEPGVPVRFGAFAVTHIPSRHVALPLGQGSLGVELEAPLVPPAPVRAWPEGGTWSILIEHPLGSVLVQGSAGFVEGALEPYTADVVLLGVGGLARQGEDYMARYFHEVVEAVGARRVVPIHYDDLTASSGGPRVPMPRLLDDVARSLAFLEARAEADPDLELALLPWWEPAVLFP